MCLVGKLSDGNNFLGLEKNVEIWVAVLVVLSLTLTSYPTL